MWNATSWSPGPESAIRLHKRTGCDPGRSWKTRFGPDEKSVVRNQHGSVAVFLAIFEWAPGVGLRSRASSWSRRRRTSSNAWRWREGVEPAVELDDLSFEILGRLRADAALTSASVPASRWRSMGKVRPPRARAAVDLTSADRWRRRAPHHRRPRPVFIAASYDACRRRRRRPLAPGPTPKPELPGSWR